MPHGLTPARTSAGSQHRVREIKLEGKVAANLSDLHVVVQGEDLKDNGTYDGQGSTLAPGVPLEAELPVACGTIN